MAASKPMAASNQSAPRRRKRHPRTALISPLGVPEKTAVRSSDQVFVFSQSLFPALYAIFLRNSPWVSYSHSIVPGGFEVMS
jgi:hypothetical protein